MFRKKFIVNISYIRGVYFVSDLRTKSIKNIFFYFKARLVLDQIPNKVHSSLLKNAYSLLLRICIYLTSLDVIDFDYLHKIAIKRLSTNNAIWLISEFLCF